MGVTESLCDAADLALPPDPDPGCSFHDKSPGNESILDLLIFL